MGWEGKSGVAIVCEGLTAAGRAVLQRAVQRAGWSVEQFAIAQAGDIPAGTRALVACGDGVLDALTGWKGGKRAAAYTRGFVLPSFTGLPVVPTFDPSKVAMGQMKLLGLVMHDLGVGLQAAGGRAGVCYDLESTVEARTGPEALRQLLARAEADPSLPVAYDLETATSWGEDEDEVIEFSRDDEEEGPDTGEDVEEESLSPSALDVAHAEIHTVQFALDASGGVSADWSDEVADLSRRMLALPNPKLSWNGFLFDQPILANHGVPLRGQHDDAMWCFKWLQPDLPAHLQGVAVTYGAQAPWKHIAGSNLAVYGVLDVTNLQLIWQKMPRALQRLGLWDAYCRFVRRFRPVIAEMEQRGIPVSREKLAQLRTWLMSEIGRMNEEMQPLVPAKLRKFVPVKVLPAPMKAKAMELRPDLVTVVETPLKNGKVRTKKTVPTSKEVYDKLACFEDGWPAMRLRLAGDFGVEIGEAEGRVWFGKSLDYNPRSPLQILEYLKSKGYPIPTKFKDGSPTTADKGLEKLEAQTKDPVIRLTRNIRAYSKLSNGYAGKVLEDGSIKGGWQPGPDGRLRATITFKSTGQLASKAPNTMTLPKRRKELAQRFRECIEAPPGYKMIECIDPSTRLMTSDLHWREARHLQIGDEVIGFDEQPIKVGDNKRAGRYLRRTVITSITKLTKPRVHIRTNKGSVICSTDHNWLKRKACRADWIEAKDLKVGHKICFFTRPWEEDGSWEGGYLAGFLDGEGFCSNGKKAGRGMGFGQNDGPIADGVVDMLKRRGFGVRMAKSTGSNCGQYQVGGHAFAWLRAIGSIRPRRLLKKAIDQIEGMAYWGKQSESATIEEITQLDDGEVLAIGTTTGTFLAEGFLSHNCDYVAFHSLTTALESRDKVMYRLAPLDPHSFVTGHLVKFPGIETCLSMNDADLKEYLNDIKKRHKNVRDFQAKPAGHGTNFKQSARRLYFEYSEHFENEKAAHRLLDLMRELFPDLFRWQDAVVREADEKGYLISKWGAIRRFFDAMTWRRDGAGRWKSVAGKGAPAAVAFRPSNDAHLMLRAKIMEAHERGWCDRYGLVNSVHDALWWLCPDGLVEECLHNVGELMEAPVMELADEVMCPGGFVCRVDKMVGKNLGRMEEVR